MRTLLSLNPLNYDLSVKICDLASGLQIVRPRGSTHNEFAAEAVPSEIAAVMTGLPVGDSSAWSDARQ
jgi:hypothetical protein